MELHYRAAFGRVSAVKVIIHAGRRCRERIATAATAITAKIAATTRLTNANASAHTGYVEDTASTTRR